MTQATKHTPTPWRAVGFTVETLDLNPICRVSKTAAHATHDNAAHIVRCVNLHDDLVQLLRDADPLIDYLANSGNAEAETLAARIGAALEKVKP